MKILFTAFNGKNNSSRILLDNIRCDNCDKLYLKNSFITSVLELRKKIKDDNYDLVISFGQWKIVSKNMLRIETIGREWDTIYKTNFDYTWLINRMKENNYMVSISENAGDYICNNLYFKGLEFIDKEKIDTKMIFIHIPKINDIDDINRLADIFNFDNK